MKTVNKDKKKIKPRSLIINAIAFIKLNYVIYSFISLIYLAKLLFILFLLGKGAKKTIKSLSMLIPGGWGFCSKPALTTA